MHALSRWFMFALYVIVDFDSNKRAMLVSFFQILEEMIMLIYRKQIEKLSSVVKSYA